MKRAGNVSVPFARATVILFSSNGSRSDSMTRRSNSGNSSRNKTPRCARVASPGRGFVPPPIMETCDDVWWGFRNGGYAIYGVSSDKRPAILWIFVTSIDSSNESGGRIPGSARAKIVFPPPGGPVIKILCPPAAAMISARFAFSCPFTSRKSIAGVGFVARGPGCAGSRTSLPSR